MIDERAKAEILEVAKEILDARTDDELNEAFRAMATVLAHFGISPK